MSDMDKQLIRQQAQEWLIDNDDELDEAQEREFARWLETPDHADAYKEALAIWHGAELLTDLAALEMPAAQTSHNTHWWQGIAAALAVISISLGIVLNTGQVEVRSHQFATAVGQTQEFVLEDGSTIILGPESSIRSRFDGNTRSIQLAQGEAYFSVTPNPQQPFVITTKQAEITVLGTRFDVNTNSRITKVVVEEGKVQVSDEKGQQPIKLSRSEAINIVDNGEVTHLPAHDTKQVSPWRQGLRVYTNCPLQTVIADLERYTQQRFIVADTLAPDLTVTAVFPTDDWHNMLAALQTVTPITITPAAGHLFVQNRISSN